MMNMMVVRSPQSFKGKKQAFVKDMFYDVKSLYKYKKEGAI